MPEVQLMENDRLDWALKAFKRQMQKAGILQELRRRRHLREAERSERAQDAGSAARSRQGQTEEKYTMRNATQTILVVDSNAETRARLVRELGPTGCRVLEAADGEKGLQLVRNVKVRLVVSELFLKTAESDCLFQAIRQNRVHGTRMLAHTVHRTSSDRDWAKLWGASGFLVQPTRTERLKHVVLRLLTPVRSNATFVRTSRRNTLSGAFAEIESGALRGTSSIVVGRSWWTGLSVSERNNYRWRAKRNGVSLRSDSMMTSNFVELRGAPRLADI